MIRMHKAIREAVISGLKTSLYLASIMVPVSFGVAILKWSGILAWISRFLAPIMKLLGLPGEAAIVIVSAMALNVYSAVAVMETLALSIREITILGIMSVSAHNLFIESAVMKKTGSSASKMIILRIVSGIVLAAIFNYLLPKAPISQLAVQQSAFNLAGFMPVFTEWAISTAKLLLKIVLLVLLIMVGQRLLDELGIIRFLSKLTGPLMKVFGLDKSASFLWLVVNTAGYAYGAGVIIDQVKSGRMKSQDADLFNHHAAVCHSLLEDTALLLAIGVSLFWLTIPRFLLAIAVVWLERLRRRLFKDSFRVGTA
ncbi:nucleoside recognition protein [Spirochaetota bacterium]